MKTKLLILAALFFIVGNSLMAQSSSFRVLAAKGDNKKGAEALKIGATLTANDQITLAEGSYVGLLHSNGQTLELREKGTFKVADLESRLSKASNNLTGRYAQYVVSEVIKDEKDADGKNLHKHMGRTGAVERDVAAAAIMSVLPKTLELAGDQTVISWFLLESVAQIKEEEVDRYLVTVTDMYNNVLFTEETKEPNFVIDLSDPRYKGERSVLYQIAVLEEGKEAIKSSVGNVKRINAKKAKETVEEVANIGDNSALGFLIKAQYFEEKGLYADAIAAYHRAISIEPQVETYQILYEGFLERNRMTRSSIMEALASNN
jgi:tetratricopeptide (TPR) repeat protein